jgi:hypothetical protein
MAPVRTSVSEERIASIFRATRIDEPGTLVVTSNRSTLRRNATEKLVFLRSVFRLLVTAYLVHSSLILVTSMTEATRSSETMVLIGATRRRISEDNILGLPGLNAMY